MYYKRTTMPPGADGPDCKVICENDLRCTAASFSHDGTSNIISPAHCFLFDVDTAGWAGDITTKGCDNRDTCFIKQKCTPKYRYEVITGNDPDVQRCTDIMVIKMCPAATPNLNSIMRVLILQFTRALRCVAPCLA